MQVIVRHVIHTDVFLNDAYFNVELYKDDTLLDTYGFYTLLVYDLESAILRIASDDAVGSDNLDLSRYHANVINTMTGDCESVYKWDSKKRIFKIK
jgi:hypothetical protein